MSQPDNKLDKFSSAVIRDAQEEREKILAEIEEYRKTELEKAEEDILHEAYLMIQNEIASIKNQQSRKISLAELEGRRRLLKQREEITGKVFNETADRILEYTRTDTYQSKMCEGVKASCIVMPEGDLIVEVKSDDLRLTDVLTQAAGRPVKVEASDAINLGGFTLVNHEKGIVIDETLDLKLNNQKDWFAASSGLSLGL